MCEIETHVQSEETEPGEWLTPGRFALFLALLVVATFPRVLFGGQTFVARDFGLFTCPLAYFHRQSFWHGELPLWNPYSSCGIPFLAQWNTLTMYPPALIYLFLPLPWSLSLFSVAHLFWGGLGMYFLANRWTGNRWAAGLAGVIFAFNGLTLNSVMWSSQMATWGWVPWVIWLTELAWHRGGRQVVWATVVGSFQMLAGGPETIVLTWLVLIALAFAQWMGTFRSNAVSALVARTVGDQEHEFSSLCESSPQATVVSLHSKLAFAEHWPRPLTRAGTEMGKFVAKRLRFRMSSGFVNVPNHKSPSDQWHLGGRPIGYILWLRFLGIAVLVAAICAAQLLPFLQLVALSNRDTGYISANWSMPIWGILNFFVPLFRTMSTPQGVLFQEGQVWTSSYYAGLATFWLAAVALRRERTGHVLIFLGLAVLGFVLSLGDRGLIYTGLRAAFPIIGLARYPVKFVLLFLVAFPLLAAFGWTSLATQRRRYDLFEWICAFVMFLLVGVTIALDRWSPRDEWSTPWRKVCENGFIGVAVLTLILYLNARFLSSRSRQQILWGLALLVALWFDFTGHLRDQNPTVAASAFSRGLAREFLHWETNPKLGSSRVMMCPAANNVLAHYMHPNPSSEEEYLVRRLAMEPNCNLLDGVPMTQGFFPLVPRQINAATQIPFIKTNVPFSGLLDFMGVSRITAPGRMFDWSERPTAMPLITCGQAAVFADDDVVFSMLEQTNLNLRRVVFLPPEARPCISATNQVSAHILSFDFSDKLVSLDAEGSAATMVAISQTYYPAWRAYVDGHPVRIWRANYAFQAVEMPAGRHRVQLRYEDKMFRNGLILSVLGIGACIVLWMSGEPLTRTMIRT